MHTEFLIFVVLHFFLANVLDDLIDTYAFIGARFVRYTATKEKTKCGPFRAWLGTYGAAATQEKAAAAINRAADNCILMNRIRWLAGGG